MAVFRIEKTRDYTVMANFHLRDRSLSLKAKGLLSLMLSLPEDWDYTTKGLAKICKDGVDSICSTVKELERHGYIIRRRVRNAKGQLTTVEYTIMEKPKKELEEPKPENPVLDGSGVEDPKLENPVLDNSPEPEKPKLENPVLGTPRQENPTQLNIQELNTKELNTKEIEEGTLSIRKAPSNQSEKKAYGEYDNVYLTNRELERLKEELSDWEVRIDRLSEYLAISQKTYGSHFAVIRCWARQDREKQNAHEISSRTYDLKAFDEITFLNYDSEERVG